MKKLEHKYEMLDQVKKQSDTALLEHLEKYRDSRMYDHDDVEIKNYVSARHECKRRKIGPFNINLVLAREWESSLLH